MALQSRGGQSSTGLSSCSHIEALRHVFRRSMPEYSNLPDVSVDWHLSNVRRNSRPVEGQNDLHSADNSGGFMIATADRCPLVLVQYGVPCDREFGIACLTATSSSCLTCGSHYCSHIARTLIAAGLPPKRRKHTVEDMRHYESIIHRMIAPDGDTLRVQGLSRKTITVPTQSAVSATTMVRTTVASTEGARGTPEDNTALSDCSSVPGSVGSEVSHLSHEGELPPMETEDDIQATMSMAQRFRYDAAAWMVYHVADVSVLVVHPSSDDVPPRDRGDWHRQPCLVRDNECDSVKIEWQSHRLHHDGPGTCIGTRQQKTMVFHLGTVYHLDMAIRVDDNKKVIPYDGSRDGVINHNNRWCFTYELLNDFLTQLSSCKTDFHNFFRNTLRSYVYSAGASQSEEDACIREELKRLHANMETRKGSKRLYKAFVDSVFDYITLQVLK